MTGGASAPHNPDRFMQWLRLLRPKQWTKNLLVYAAAIFTGSFSREALVTSSLAFAAMCLAASGTYALNDAVDARRDREHPKKKLRPVASGAVPLGGAVALGAVLVGASLALAYAVQPMCAVVVGAYLAIQGLYNLGIKRAPITDVFFIALGFVLRAVLGGIALNVAISGWLLFCTMSLALTLGFSKRRAEYLRSQKEGFDARESLAHYSQPLLDYCVAIFAAASILSFGVYSIESDTAKAHPALMGTTLFVAYGVTRYLYRVFHDDVGEEPESMLLTDPHLAFSVIGFIAAAAWALANKGASV